MRKIKEAGESQVCLCGQMQRERERRPAKIKTEKVRSGRKIVTLVCFDGGVTVRN